MPHSQATAKMKVPLVSVLIFAYNHENYVEQAIDSVMIQTYNPIELLGVGGRSTASIFGHIKRAVLIKESA
jgi:hypothetical protein